MQNINTNLDHKYLCHKGTSIDKEKIPESHVIPFISCHFYLHLGCRMGPICASSIFSRIVTTHQKSDWLIYEVANGQNHRRGCLQFRSALLSIHSYLPYHLVWKCHAPSGRLWSVNVKSGFHISDLSAGDSLGGLETMQILFSLSYRGRLSLLHKNFLTRGRNDNMWWFLHWVSWFLLFWFFCFVFSENRFTALQPRKKKHPQSLIAWMLMTGCLTCITTSADAWHIDYLWKDRQLWTSMLL